MLNFITVVPGTHSMSGGKNGDSMMIHFFSFKQDGIWLSSLSWGDRRRQKKRRKEIGKDWKKEENNVETNDPKYLFILIFYSICLWVLWTEGLSPPPPNSYIEALISNVIKFGGGGLWEVIKFRWDLEGRVPMMRLVPLCIGDLYIEIFLYICV